MGPPWQSRPEAVIAYVTPAGSASIEHVNRDEPQPYRASASPIGTMVALIDERASTPSSTTRSCA
jgi:hypothetical protein